MELRRYLFMFRRHVVLMIVVLVAGIGIAYVTSSHAKTYQAQSTLLIGQSAIRPDPKSGQNISDPIIAAQLAASTYARMLTSETTAQQAVQSTGVARDPKEVASHTVATEEASTLLINIDVRDHDPVVAAKLATGMATTLIAQLDNLVPSSKSDPPTTLYQAASAPSTPIASTVKRNVEVGALFGLVLAGALAILLEYLDVTVRGSVDAERTVELPVLGSVPLCADA